MLRPGRVEGSTEWPAVDGREIEGNVIPSRCLQDPSSEGLGRSDGRDCQLADDGVAIVRMRMSRDE